MSTYMDDDRLFVATESGVHCVDVTTGRAYWTHHYAVRVESAPTVICRWNDVVVVASSTHVIAVSAANGSGVFLAKLPPPFGGCRRVRVLARRERLIVHDSIAIAGLGRSGVVEWLYQLAPSYPAFMPSVLWGDVSREGLEWTFDRR